MTQVPKVPRIWNLLESFKESCHRKGWKTSDYEDIIEFFSTSSKKEMVKTTAMINSEIMNTKPVERR